MPNDAQIKKLKELPLESPVAVLNLFKFNAQAQYQVEDLEYNLPAANISGREAYSHYAAVAGKFLTKLGGKVVFSAAIDQIMIGPQDTDWDVSAIMYFPTRRAFIEMLTNPEFQKASRHRKAALSNHVMIHLDGTSF